jgi:predicted DNA-binding transcriptional regulator AlpA
VSARFTIAPSLVPTLKRGLKRLEAAAYIGVGATKFDEMVDDGRMPKPISIDTRKVWDVRALDSSFDDLSAEINEWKEFK